MRKNFKSGIYQIKNEINQKVYIGHSIDILKRWGWHKNRLRYQKHSNTHLQNAWSKYTETNFSFRILELIESPTKEQLEEREDYWIDFYESDKDEKGYNKQKAQQGTFTEKWHQKERERKKEKQTKKDYSYYSNKSYFKDISEEDKQKIISNLLKYTESCFISINRKSNKMQITLTNHITFEVKKVYIFLNPFQIVTKEEFDKSNKNTRGD